MTLPFELTTLPSGALDILRFLYTHDNYAAYDAAIIEGLGITERGFGKAIRRLVTREYVEMQFDGPYALTEKGVEAAEAVEAHSAEALHEAAPDDEALELDVAETAIITRRLIVVYPKTFAAGQPGYLFLRVEAPATDDDLAPTPTDLVFRLQTECASEPAQRDVTVPPDEASQAVRFAVTPPRKGEFKTSIEVFQATTLDLIEAGLFEVMLDADDLPAPADAFRREDFEIQLPTGL